MINTTNIYFLHLGDGIPFYIGKTKTSLKQRLNQHRSSRGNYNIQITLIDIIPTPEWKFWEEFYIELFLTWGFDLYENKTRKGRGPEDSRICTWGNKISKSLKGKTPKWNNPNEIEERRKRQTGKKYLLNYKYSNIQKENQTEGKRKHILQYDLEGNLIKEWYATFQEIAKSFGKNHSSLTHYFKGKQKSSYGFLWKIKK